MARTKLQFYFLAAGVVFMTMFAGVLYRMLADGHATNSHLLVKICWAILRVIFLIITLLLAAVCFHISNVKASKYYTFTSILMKYVSYHFIMNFLGRSARPTFDEQAKCARHAQEEFLRFRMKRDANTVYGRLHNFNKIKSLEDLRNNHPITSYGHYKEYVQRMADGEKDVLISEELTRFGITSGTTGKGKLIPLVKSRIDPGMDSVMPSLYSLMLRISGEKYGYPSPLQKEIHIYVNPRPTTTPGGHIIGPMHLYTEDVIAYFTALGVVPPGAFSISTEREAHYITVLFGLRDPDVGRWFAPFSSQVHKVMSLVENNWEQLVHDIKTGTVYKDLQLSGEIRIACEKALSSEPGRAEELRREFEKGFDGIMLRIWPYLKYIHSIDVADFNEKLKLEYAKGVPIIAPMYGSTEGDYGLNLWPDEDKYALIPNSCIYEFIREDDISDSNPKTLFLDEVEKGESYEMIVSPLCGFYRYRFGDVIKVVDFYYNLPVVQFMYRSGQLLNLRAEKVTEVSVDEAVQHMVINMTTEAKVAGWTAAENTLLDGIDQVPYEKGSQFYLVFVELDSEGYGDINALMSDEQQQQFDEALQERSNYYRGYRCVGTLSPPRVYFVKPGTFNALREYIIAKSSASYNQFKVPRKLKTTGSLELMLNSRRP